MSSTSSNLPWSTMMTTGVFLGGLASVLYNSATSPDYRQLVESIKAHGVVLYPNLTSTIVHTSRVQLYSQREASEDDVWTATVSTKATNIVLAEVAGQRSREQALKALDELLKKTWEENIEKARLRGGHERGEEFEERNGIAEGDMEDEEGLCCGDWR